jgi:spore germination protein YaaH
VSLASVIALVAAAGVLLLSVAARPAVAVTPRSDAHPAAPPGAATPTPTPSAGSLQAFVLTSSPDSFADLQAHVGAVGAIYPTYFQCAGASGSVLGSTDPTLDAYAAAHALPELPRFTCQDGATVHRILTDPALRGRTLARLLALAVGAGYAGLNLDLENDGARDRRALSSFAAALAAGLHAEHRRFAVDVVGVQREDRRHATYLYDDRALASVADIVFAMAWGVHWERSAPGPNAPLPYVRAVARRLARLPHARRFVLGVPLYGLDWPGRGGRAQPATALQYAGIAALASSVGAAPARDPRSGEMTFAYSRGGLPHHVWFMDARAVAQRIAIARRYGLGAGVWRLGEEDQGLWGPLGAGR